MKEVVSNSFIDVDWVGGNIPKPNFYATHQQVSEFADCLADELEERSEPLRHDAAVNGCYRSTGFDVVQITASALSSWIDRRGTGKEFRNIIARLCLSLARLDIAVGLCSDRFQWKPPAKTMQILTEFCKKRVMPSATISLRMP